MFIVTVGQMVVELQLLQHVGAFITSVGVHDRYDRERSHEIFFGQFSGQFILE